MRPLGCRGDTTEELLSVSFALSRCDRIRVFLFYLGLVCPCENVSAEYEHKSSHNVILSRQELKENVSK